MRALHVLVVICQLHTGLLRKSQETSSTCLRAWATLAVRRARRTHWSSWKGGQRVAVPFALAAARAAAAAASASARSFSSVAFRFAACVRFSASIRKKEGKQGGNLYTATRNDEQAVDR